MPHTVSGLITHPMNGKKSPLFGIISLLITGAILIAGLWPFNFHPVNKVAWILKGNGIHFYGQSIVFSTKTLLTHQTASRDATITIELLLRPDKEFRNTVPSILTLFGDDQSDHFVVSQWKSGLIIRVPVVKAEHQQRYREISVGNALRKEMTRLITVTSGKETTDIYIDGKREKQFPHYSLIRDNHGLSGRLILGNSPEGTAHWNGSFLGLAIYDRALNTQEALEHDLAWRQGGKPLLSIEKKPIALYFFEERGGQQIQDHAGSGNHLLMPASFRPLRRIILGMPENNQWFSRSNMMDVTINILGFVPFGFFLIAWLVQVRNIPFPRAFVISVLLGFSISLMIELTQAYLPMRDSSLLDLINNTLGTVVGALLLKIRTLSLSFGRR